MSGGLCEVACRGKRIMRSTAAYYTVKSYGPGWSADGKSFSTTLHVKPRAWERTEGNRHMPASQRSYYYALYAELASAGMRPLKEYVEYGIELRFYRTDYRGLDCDNVLKAFQDAGQPSNWVDPKKDIGYVDYWNDRIFEQVHVYRTRGAREDKIEVKIWELSSD